MKLDDFVIRVMNIFSFKDVCQCIRLAYSCFNAWIMLHTGSYANASLLTLFYYIFVYRYHSVKRILAAERYFVELPVHHRQMVPNFRENLQIMRTCVDHNYEIIKLILDGTGMLFENKHVYLEDVSFRKNLKKIISIMFESLIPLYLYASK